LFVRFIVIYVLETFSDQVKKAEWRPVQIHGKFWKHIRSLREKSVKV